MRNKRTVSEVRRAIERTHNSHSACRPYKHRMAGIRAQSFSIACRLSVLSTSRALSRIAVQDGQSSSLQIRKYTAFPFTAHNTNLEVKIIARLANHRYRSETPSLSLPTEYYAHEEKLVSVHAHSLGAPAHLTVSGRADRSAGGTTTVCAALLQRKQLLGAECLVVDLGGGLDKVLEVGSEQKVSQVDEFAVVLILNVDDAPAVLTTADLLAVDNDVLLRANNRKRNQALQTSTSAKRSLSDIKRILKGKSSMCLP